MKKEERAPQKKLVWCILWFVQKTLILGNKPICKSQIEQVPLLCQLKIGGV
jgi:hypothetical protein